MNEREMESALYDVAYFNEKQYAIDLKALATGKSIEEVDAVIKGREPVLA